LRVFRPTRTLSISDKVERAILGHWKSELKPNSRDVVYLLSVS